MTQVDVLKIVRSEKYQKLVTTRARYSWIMTSLVLIVYFGYIYLVAYHKDFLATHFGDSMLTYSIPIGIGVILFTIIITGIYVRRANSEFDRLTDEIKAELK